MTSLHSLRIFIRAANRLFCRQLFVHHMVREICLAYIKVLLWFPGLVSALFVIEQGAVATGMPEEQPQQFQFLDDTTGFFFAALVDHWLLWLIVSVPIAAIWVLWFKEPKAESKRKFDERRASRNARAVRK